MDTCINKIREIALELLEKNEVDKVIGFTEGTIPLSSIPVAVTTKQDVEKLIFNSTCTLNLANYIRNNKGKTAIIAKGCDSRNIVSHIVENQVQRDQLYIIGVPCEGMVDKAKIASLFEDEILSFSDDGDILNIKSSLKEEKLNKNEFLRENCKLCMHKNPVVYDILAADLIEESKLDKPYPDVEKIENMDLETKGKHFEDLTKNCIRCYACRNACPICYCPTCFVDESAPQWVGKGQNKTDVNTFHFLRAFHCAGRCTDCGACVSACPMNINVRDFTRKLNKDCFEMFDWEPGLDIDKRPPLDAFSPDDPDDFIK
jgi:formate dehydrogenase (coenzyme F420) beta subunit